MLDQKLIRENPTFVAEKLSRRGKTFELSNLNKLTLKLKDTDIELSNLQSESKKLSRSIGEIYQKSNDSSPADFNKMKNHANNLKANISTLEIQKRDLNKEILNELLKLPNFPSDDSPSGNDESQNVEIKKWGNPTIVNNQKSHWEIGENLNLFDSKRSSKISKSRFITLIGDGARLERALINFMLDTHFKKGYLELIPPALVNSNSLQGSGQLPKFSNESFKCSDDDLWLLQQQKFR